MMWYAYHLYLRNVLTTGTIVPGHLIVRIGTGDRARRLLFGNNQSYWPGDALMGADRQGMAGTCRMLLSYELG